MIVTILAVALAGWVIRKSFWANSEVGAASRDRWFVDAATGKPFRKELELGMSVPIDAPSGGKTGYPAELCYWTADGQIKQEPTPVLVVKLWPELGKNEPTFCPDCGRLVVGRNPVPQPGDHPPPKKDEFKPGGRF